MAGGIYQALRLMRFSDRTHAGEALGELVAAQEPANPIVLALPRGGVPVGKVVADRLGCPLDILLVRKIGVPGQPELAMGAVAEGGVVIRNQGIIDLVGIGEQAFEAVLRDESAVLSRRAKLYRGSDPPLDPEGHTVLVVDDGLATGSTALAAIEALRSRGVGEIWVCVPVAPVDTAEAMARVADRVVVVHQPERFGAVGVWYRNFSQTGDDEVRALLAESRLR